MLACVLAGLLVAGVGSWLSGSAAWYLAIPAAIAVGWLFLADPTQCAPAARKSAEGRQDDEAAL